MDLDDISEYYMLHLFGNRSRDKFCEQEKIHSLAIVLNLLKVHYVIHKNNECWTRDIADSLKQKPNVYKKVEIGMYFLSQGRYVKEIGKDKVLGKKWELTNKGLFLLGRYTLHLREEQRNVNYRVKKSHVESIELKENM